MDQRLKGSIIFGPIFSYSSGDTRKFRARNPSNTLQKGPMARVSLDISGHDRATEIALETRPKTARAVPAPALRVSIQLTYILCRGRNGAHRDFVIAP